MINLQPCAHGGMEFFMETGRSVLKNMNQEQRFIFDRTMELLDGLYDEKAHLLFAKAAGEGGRHDVRGSSHYALGLLTRGGEGDFSRAQDVIRAVLSMQYQADGEIFDGTFKRTPDEPNPPMGKLPWRRITPDARYHMDLWEERIVDRFRRALAGSGAYSADAVRDIEAKLNQSILSELPVVWATYDPNWREFISCAFAMIIELYEDELDEKLVDEIDEAMKRAVRGSIDRKLANLTPMNTNVEIMHIFISAYFGTRYSDSNVVAYAHTAAADFYSRYKEFDSVAEFNSPTYCSVDLAAFAQWRMYGTPFLQKLGAEMEANLWQNIADFYNANLRNICGPFARNYEMDLGLHSSMHTLIYLGLGSDLVPEPPDNQEREHNTQLAITGTIIPPHLKRRFAEHDEDRLVTKQFRELMERGDPAANNPLCTCTAWIEKDLMLGAMSGSHNHSNQLHTATIYWKAPDGTISSIRLLRREAGGGCNHYRTILFNNTASKRHLSSDVEFDVTRDIELFFECNARGIEPAMIGAQEWNLPGLQVRLEAKAPAPLVRMTDEDFCEAVYAYHYGDTAWRTMHFEIDFTPVS